MFSRKVRIVRSLVWVLPWSLAACAGFGGSRGPSGVVNVTELHRSNLCGTQSATPQITLLSDAAALQAWQAAHNVDFFDGRAASMGRGAYAVVELGQRNSGGYSLLVSRRAQLRDGVLQLTASFLKPPAGQMSVQLISSPCVLVALPPLDLRQLVLLDPSGDERARWRAGAAAVPTVPAPVPVPAPAVELPPAPTVTAPVVEPPPVPTVTAPVVEPAAAPVANAPAADAPPPPPALPATSAEPAAPPAVPDAAVVPGPPPQ